ncbi:MAG: hypothetical protein ACXABG_14380 [Promethearchaeota archaeon]|jgi:adenylylsulfate kinase-like enzyme
MHESQLWPMRFKKRVLSGVTGPTILDRDNIRLDQNRNLVFLPMDRNENIKCNDLLRDCIVAYEYDI